MLFSPTCTFAIIQIINPAGAATITALPSTNSVLSKTDLTITFPICGFLYGGSSKANDEGMPFNIVFDKIFETNRVVKTPSIIVQVNKNVENKDTYGPAAKPAKNMVIIAINVGNLPLQGTKLFVIMAISFSLGESIILQPITPQALQPNPMHMVRACFP